MRTCAAFLIKLFSLTLGTTMESFAQATGSLRLSVKIGDLVRFRSSGWQQAHAEWLGLIVREIPGTDEVKVVEWTHKNMGTNHGSHPAQDLVLVQK